jgi:hypothetical protein
LGTLAVVVNNEDIKEKLTFAQQMGGGIMTLSLETQQDTEEQMSL